MITILVLLFGFALPSLLGWLLLLHAEGRTIVLGRAERIVWGMALGPTLMMLLVFLLHVLGIVSLTLLGFLIPTVLLIIGLAFLAHRRTLLWPRDAHSEYREEKRAPWKTALLAVLILWTAFKLFAGAYDLWNVPTYWDDSFNNWNMRGKVFFVKKSLELQYVTENDVQQILGGVSSYPPTVPLVKTWLSSLRGSWQEPLVNSVHFVWFLILLASMFLFVSRMQGKTRGWIAVYALTSLPLLLIHGTNPYADIFVGMHVFLASICLLQLSNATTHTVRPWMMLSGITIGTLVFTKNEALLLYTPVLIVLSLWQLWRQCRVGKSEAKACVRTLIIFLGIIALVVVPWLGFKWMQGLTFGNAKAVGDTVLMLNQRAAHAIWFSLSKEANVLLLPLFLMGSLLLKYRTAFRLPLLSLTLFVLLIFVMQSGLFIFVQALANEAIKQTGLARGLVHIAPSALLLLFLLWEPKNTQSS